MTIKILEYFPLNPNAYSCRLMLQICEEFSSEFNIMFKPAKTKMLMYNTSDDDTANVNIMFNGANITISENEKHLGTYIGQNSNSLTIVNGTR